MKMKIFIWIIGTLLLIPVALAQTGLFSTEGGTSLATFGILAVIAFFVIKEIAKNFKNFRK